MDYVIAIDVGTGSVRGALVEKTGRIINIEIQTIETLNYKPQFYEQSSTEIWSSCCKIIQKITHNIPPDKIKGIGFDATCSLVIIDKNDEPISVSENCYDDDKNIILWMDHRATEEADFINQTNHLMLNYVGGKVSPEMMTPKILWLKNHLFERFQKVEHFFLLPDFLTWRATGETTRSVCSLVCKCNYKSSPEGSSWPKEFFNLIGLGELAENDWMKLGSKIRNPGEVCGKLSEKAAGEIGLLPGIPVSVSLIDAHAGGVGLFGCVSDNVSNNLMSRLALIMGTSTCHMWLSENEIFFERIWGPFYNALVPSYWLLEGGQSASGKLIDHIIESHPETKNIKKKIGKKQITEYLNELLYIMQEDNNFKFVDELTTKIHVWPDFHGNRSPISDPNLTGMILGLTLESGERDLAIKYLSTIQALAYGTKHIIEHIEKKTVKPLETILICGGLSKNILFVQTHANVLEKKILVPEQIESVLLGSAVTAACASKLYPDMLSAMMEMAGNVNTVEKIPNTDISKFHNKKYKVYFELLKCQNRCRKIMLN